jgi:hypothetical protein
MQNRFSLIQEKGEIILEKTGESRRWLVSTSTAFQKKRGLVM